MADLSVAAASTQVEAAGLPERLRTATRPWHDKVEALADIPGRIRSRTDYIALLGTMAALHHGLEAEMSAPTWERAWARVGVQIAAHRRARLLDADLAALGGPVADRVPCPPFPSFGHAMGCLYVLEGSALGGRIVAGMVRAALGEMPTSFLTGGGRRPLWPAVRAALRRYDQQDGDPDAVVDGAVSTFAIFAAGLARAVPAS